MRRAALVLTVGMLFAAAACGTVNTPTVGGSLNTGATAPSAQAALAETRASCEALGQAYGANIGPFAQALSTMVAGRNAPDGAKASQELAQQKLSAFATAIRGATKTSADAPTRTIGEQTAKRLQAKSADDKFFSQIQTTKDVEKVIGTTLKEWLAPVTKLCA